LYKTRTYKTISGAYSGKTHHPVARVWHMIAYMPTTIYDILMLRYGLFMLFR